MRKKFNIAEIGPLSPIWLPLHFLRQELAPSDADIVAAGPVARIVLSFENSRLCSPGSTGESSLPEGRQTLR